MTNHGLFTKGNSERISHKKYGFEGRMIQLRYWQLLVNEMLKGKAFKVPVHLGIGSEALVTAVDEMLTELDLLVLTHRNATYNMARAANLNTIIAEYSEQADGLGSGKLGSMNLANPQAGITYSSSILGNNFSVACGLAFANEIKAKKGVVCVVTGDGAMEEGAFYEALVFSRSHNLRVLFLIDNNNHSMVSSIPERRCNIDLAMISGSVNIPFLQLEGNDVSEYVDKIKSARSRIIVENTPFCLEVKTALLNQHAGPTPGWPTDSMKVEMTSDFLVADAPRDPLAVLKSSMGSEAYLNVVNHLVEPLKQ
jgi:TPP-dependent pyruvate/acetoin dehydrogenase alpha subunit